MSCRSAGHHRSQRSAEDDYQGRPLGQVGYLPSFEQQAAQDSGECDARSCQGSRVDSSGVGFLGHFDWFDHGFFGKVYAVVADEIVEEIR